MMIGAFGAASARTEAFADEYQLYGGVVCDGARALVRFTGAYNDGAPTFPAPPPDFDRGLSVAPMADPSTCRLNDGRVVRLRHGSMGDATPYGASGGVATELFTLEVGDRTLFRRAAVWRHGEPFPSLAGLIIDGEQVVECRYSTAIYQNREAPQTCRDISTEIRAMSPEHYPSAPGTLYLDYSAPGRSQFCMALTAQAPQSYDGESRAAAWQARVSRRVDRIVDEYTLRERDYVRFDLDNDGHPDLPIAMGTQSNYIDALIWVLAPDGAPQQTVTQLVDNAADLRSEGWRIYGGDQTAFGEIRYVTMLPIIRDGVTYLHARWAIPQLDRLSDIILLPKPDGALDEICAFRRTPAF
jgi:hypothetical protein